MWISAFLLYEKFVTVTRIHKTFLADFKLVLQMSYLVSTKSFESFVHAQIGYYVSVGRFVD